MSTSKKSNSSIQNVNSEIDTQYNFVKCKIKEVNVSLSNEHSVRQSTLLFDLPEAISSFCGRVSELSQISDSFSKTKLVALCGSAGIGKTELAKIYAWNNSDKYNGNLIWLNAHSEETLQKSIRALAEELKTINNESHRELKNIMKDIYFHFENRKALFIFDNAKDRRSINVCLPSIVHENIHVLITSRNTRWSADVRSIVLEPVSDSVGMQVLTALLGDVFDMAEDRDDWVELARSLRGVPLALQAAAMEIRQEADGLDEEFTIDNYIAKIKMKKDFVLDKTLTSDTGIDYNNNQ